MAQYVNAVLDGLEPPSLHIPQPPAAAATSGGGRTRDAAGAADAPSPLAQLYRLPRGQRTAQTRQRSANGLQHMQGFMQELMLPGDQGDGPAEYAQEEDGGSEPSGLDDEMLDPDAMVCTGGATFVSVFVVGQKKCVLLELTYKTIMNCFFVDNLIAVARQNLAAGDIEVARTASDRHQTKFQLVYPCLGFCRPCLCVHRHCGLFAIGKGNDTYN